jgi:hypothetical protein
MCATRVWSNGIHHPQRPTWYDVNVVCIAQYQLLLPTTFTRGCTVATVLSTHRVVAPATNVASTARVLTQHMNAGTQLDLQQAVVNTMSH